MKTKTISKPKNLKRSVTRKRLFCFGCNQPKSCEHVGPSLQRYECRTCGSAIDMRYGLKELAKHRAQKRTRRAKSLGTYKSKQEKRLERRERGRELDPEYVLWVKSLPCCVPGCYKKAPSDAHHVIHRSQGGSDRTCVPLCHEHHIGEYHGQLGSPERAREVWGVDLMERVSVLNRQYDEQRPAQSEAELKSPGDAQVVSRHEAK